MHTLISSSLELGALPRVTSRCDSRELELYLKPDYKPATPPAKPHFPQLYVKNPPEFILLIKRSGFGSETGKELTFLFGHARKF